MKRRLGICFLGLVFLPLCCPVVQAEREAKGVQDIGLSACVFLGQYDPRAAAWTMTTYNKFLTVKNPSFLSVREVKALDDADDCDIAIRVSQPDTFSVKTDVFSPETKEVLVSVEEKGVVIFNPSDKVISRVTAALGADTSLGKRLVQQRQSRLSQAQKAAGEAVGKTKSRPDGKEATPVMADIRSDIDDVPATAARRNKNAYAIIIGIETYRQRLPKVDYAERDARLVSQYLTKAMGYPEENVITLLNEHATHVDLAKYLEKWLPNNAEKDSTVFIYYSGHGAPDPKTGNAYLVPYDGDASFIAETGYPLRRLYDALGKLSAKEIIVALDSCFSGAGGRSVLAKGARPLVMNLQGNLALSKNVTVLSASSGEQISSTYEEKGHGLFTYFLLKGIKNEDVVKPDGSLKMDDLYSYLKPQVERIARKQYNNEQTPQLIGAKKN